ncbi:hypothetical protein L3049_07945 [Labilibaculum sp. DW002]|uniref:EGF-like domain-containing protein n=1 Tax=Paralabilibaculum antarcticum TaxID=2912572 RepID=A0ABT5VR82_9BACT|nr:hypothetical protein [Labilibaculum sp. DW002]MDE5417937.1 hypothetical protein [Labilibaculum sp. DW002]
MKNTLLKNIGVVAIILLTVIASHTFTSSEGQFSLDAIECVAMADGESGGSGVSCYCGQTYGRGCKADNRGSRCNPEGSSDCWNYDRNCN